jgi:glyoxylase-like metal-dependent hydrolase (beta-lactamase superfamily II)
MHETLGTSRAMVAGILLGLSACSSAEAPGEIDAGSSQGWSTLTSYNAALALVERAQEVLGGVAAIERAGGVTLEGAGVIDLGTLLQGRRPFEGDEYPVEERIAILPAEDRLVHEDRTPLNPDANSWSRQDYRRDGTYRINLETGRATWSRPADHSAVQRAIPHYLLAEVLAEPATLRHLGTVRVAGEVREAVSWEAPGGGLITLLFDPTTGMLRGVESVADLPVRGDAIIRWSLFDYEPVPGLGPFPIGYSIQVDGEMLREIRWTQRNAAPSGGVLESPPGIVLPEATAFPPATTGSGGGSGASTNAAERPEFDIRDLAPGVHLLVNLRTGFHVLFVEFEDHVVAVDAPAGWWELQELPARDWAESASPALGERFVAGIRSRIGGKPIRYVVLTHHHGDHAGGVRAFVDEGAAVLAAEITRSVVERTLAGSLTLAGRGSLPTPTLEFAAIEGERILRDGSMEMRILDVGPNPHSEGMLAVWLPGPRILYVSDLFDPWGPTGSLPAQRLPVMRWFVEWLDGSGLEPERIYAIHGSGLVSASNLEEVRRFQ